MIKKLKNRPLGMTYFQMLILLIMGISSGIPLALTGGTLQAWMKDEGISLQTIGLFAAVGLPYTFKFFWAPLMDRFTILPLGRRRGWMFLSQGLLFLSILALAFTDPKTNLIAVGIFALFVSFMSASQDIVMDAWRRESLKDEELGFGGSIHVAGYLFAARMISGALALFLADHYSWSQVYFIMSLFIALGMVTTLIVKEPNNAGLQPRNMKEAVIDPFVDFFKRNGAVTILIFILLYKMGDNLAGQMTTPFYLDIGFTKTQIAAVTKLTGWIALALGGLSGGLIIMRWGIVKSLFGFGILQGLSTFGFAMLAEVGPSMDWLAGVIAFENFTAGMGTAAFVAFMATLTNKKYTATQYALLTSLMGVPRVIFASYTGYLATDMGWFNFFSFCALVAIPGIALIPYMARMLHQVEKS